MNKPGTWKSDQPLKLVAEHHADRLNATAAPSRRQMNKQNKPVAGATSTTEKTLTGTKMDQEVPKRVEASTDHRRGRVQLPSITGGHRPRHEALVEHLLDAEERDTRKSSCVLISNNGEVVGVGGCRAL